MTERTAVKANDEISSIFSERTKITQAIQSGINIALLKHKQAGKAVCEWKDNKVHWIPAEKIEVK
ncbi:MAG: hypothetical protein V4496_00320 [Pseudomonadota bacterium]